MKKQSPIYKNMAYLTKKLAEILWEGMAGKEDIAEKFLAVLKEKKKKHLLKEIVKELEKIKESKQNQLILSRPTNPKMIEAIKAGTKKYFNNGGDWKVRIDEEIIGGFIIKNRTLLIDASVKKTLNKIFNKI